MPYSCHIHVAFMSYPCPLTTFEAKEILETFEALENLEAIETLEAIDTFGAMETPEAPTPRDAIISNTNIYIRIAQSKVIHNLTLSCSFQINR